MSNYSLSTKADSDIDNIAEYTLNTWGELQAHEYISDLLQFLQILADNSTLGRSASVYAPKLKRHNFKAHTVFFEPTKNGIFVVRILDQRQDFKLHL